jgi:hypothetical protein
MNSYCLIHAHGWFVINSDTMHGKCRILRSKITEFRVMEMCNLIGGFWSGHTASIFWWSVKIDPDGSSIMFITMHQTTLCPMQGRIMNPHYCEHLKFLPKNIKNNCSHDENVTLGKQNYRSVVCLSDIVFNINTFSTNCIRCGSYFASQTKWGNEIWNISWLQTLSA